MTRRILLLTLGIAAIETVTACGGSNSATTPGDSDGSVTAMPDGPDAATDDSSTAVDAGEPGSDAKDATIHDAAMFIDAADAALDTAVPDAAACDGQCVISFASGTEWAAYDDDPATNVDAHYLGAARTVCLNATSPPNCPIGALNYGFGAAAWSFSLAAIPGAYWVWGPGIAATDIADLKRFYFVQRFALGDRPSGWLSIGTDDAAEIRVNGQTIGTIGSVTDIQLASVASTRLTTFDLTPRLVPGMNTITIAAQNGPSSFAGCAGGCTYRSNPAGSVFGGSLRYH